tara:strand:- start:209 stop:367 length:159 start_codon:yes stop_codon:yes gene_type:complete
MELRKATFGRYKGDYVVYLDIRGQFRDLVRPVGKDEKIAKKSFKQQCKRYKN